MINESAPMNLRSLLEEMIEKGASDLHLSAGEVPKLRVDGQLCDSDCQQQLGPRDTQSLAYSVLTEQQKKRYEQEDELEAIFEETEKTRDAFNAASAALADYIRGLEI